VRLLRNDGHGKFEDVTEKTGIRREKGCVAATFVDYDHDGDLDLYLTMAPTVKRVRTGFGATTEIPHSRTSRKNPAWPGCHGRGVVMTDFNNDRRLILLLPVGRKVPPFS